MSERAMAPPGITLRRLASDDAPAYRALMLQAYADHPEAYTSTVAEREPLPLAWWEARIAAGEAPAELVIGAFDGAFDGAPLVGLAGLQFNLRERTAHKALLFGMAVARATRRRGVGRCLVEAVLDAAARVPRVRMVHLTVSQGNEAALALYRACGFEAWGIEPEGSRIGERAIAKVHMWRLVRSAAASA